MNEYIVSKLTYTKIIRFKHNTCYFFHIDVDTCNVDFECQSL